MNSDQEDAMHAARAVATRRNRLAVTPLLACALSCASIAAPSPQAPAAAQTTLEAAEIRTGSARNAYEAVEDFRPLFLAGVRGGAPGALAVYVDGDPVSDITYLRTIPAGTIRKIELLHAAQAMVRFGSARPAVDALIVTTEVPRQ